MKTDLSKRNEGKRQVMSPPPPTQFNYSFLSLSPVLFDFSNQKQQHSFAQISLCGGSSTLSLPDLHNQLCERCTFPDDQTCFSPRRQTPFENGDELIVLHVIIRINVPQSSRLISFSQIYLRVPFLSPREKTKRQLSRSSQCEHAQLVTDDDFVQLLANPTWMARRTSRRWLFHSDTWEEQSLSC